MLHTFLVHGAGLAGYLLMLFLITEKKQSFGMPVCATECTHFVKKRQQSRSNMTPGQMKALIPLVAIRLMDAPNNVKEKILIPLALPPLIF